MSDNKDFYRLFRKYERLGGLWSALGHIFVFSLFLSGWGSSTPAPPTVYSVSIISGASLGGIDQAGIEPDSPDAAFQEDKTPPTPVVEPEDEPLTEITKVPTKVPSTPIPTLKKPTPRPSTPRPTIAATSTVLPETPTPKATPAPSLTPTPTPTRSPEPTKPATVAPVATKKPTLRPVPTKLPATATAKPKPTKATPPTVKAVPTRASVQKLKVQKKPTLSAYEQTMKKYLGNSVNAGGNGFGAGSTGGNGMGGGTQVPPEFLEYKNTILDEILARWRWHERRTSLKASVIMKISPDGRILSSEISRPSGNYEFDRSVLRAVNAANPLPPPPKVVYEYFRDVELIFQPGR